MTDKASTREDHHSVQRPWHSLHTAEVVSAVGSDVACGLTSQEAQARLDRYGPNALREPKRRSLLAVVLGQFKSPFIYLLFGVAAIALALGHTSDAIVVSVVVLLNALVGAFQEGRAERSLEGLRKLATREARLVRDGQELIVEAREVVVGDLLILEAGDAVAADARLVDGAALHVAEAALTGESTPVDKLLAPLPSDTLLADRSNMVYAGTHVTTGRARALVVATGLSSEIGHIAELTEAVEEPQTPLERRIAQLGHYVMLAAAAMFALVMGVGLLHGLPAGEILMVAISQVVGMVPEGLPVAMTVALAVGVQRMARRHAVVRRLSAVETLGSTTIVCTDKTGTLTRNEMTVTEVCLPGGRRLVVTGVGYEPTGSILDGQEEANPADLDLLLRAAILCNDAQLRQPGQDEPRWMPIGDPTEVALIVMAMKGGLVPSEVRARSPRRSEIPFDAVSKMMATQHDDQAGAYVIIKGAPEAVLDLCESVRRSGANEPLDDEGRKVLHGEVERMAESALRVLAIAVVEGTKIEDGAELSAFRNRAVLLGLIGQLDPPRMEVKSAVARCREAGIRPVMLTGDHKATGYAIARQLGIAQNGDAAVDGRELEQMSDLELSERIGEISVFARVQPAQKLRIVSAYQKLHEVVAMTGDGVNDTPALVEADVGVAMGITGTEVAKEAAKIVIGDDNFSTIVAAVEEGRVVYRNIKKVVLYLFSTALAEVLILLIAITVGYPPPLVAVQILWINLVTEGTVTVNLIMDPAEGDEMKQKPISADEPLLTRVLLMRMAFMTPAITCSTLGWFIARLSFGVPFVQVQTETFTVLAVCQWFNVLNCRSERRSVFALSLMKNPWLVGGLVMGNLLQAAVIYLPSFNATFHTVPIGLGELLGIGAVASLVLWVEETRKFVMRRRKAHVAPHHTRLEQISPR